MTPLTERLDAAGQGEAFFAAYAEHLRRLLAAGDVAGLAKAVTILQHARREGRLVFVAGNGGSAATANHFAHDLAWGARRADVPHIRAMSLTGNESRVTALGNDIGYERIFVEQLAVLARPGDVLVAISASGNSPNILRAVEYMNAHDGRTIGLTGFDGGALRSRCHAVVHVATAKGEYGPVEDLHMVACHMLVAHLCAHAE